MSLILLLAMISTSMTRCLSILTINLVPLHRTIDWFKFLSNVIGTPTFNSREWIEIPLNFNVFRNSYVYKRFYSSSYMLVILSVLKYIFSHHVLCSIYFHLHYEHHHCWWKNCAFLKRKVVINLFYKVTINVFYQSCHIFTFTIVFFKIKSPGILI